MKEIFHSDDLNSVMEAIELKLQIQHEIRILKNFEQSEKFYRQTIQEAKVVVHRSIQTAVPLMTYQELQYKEARYSKRIVEN